MLSARVRLFRKGYDNYLEEDMATHSSILPGEFHGQRSLVGYSPWGQKETRLKWFSTHQCMITISIQVGTW